MTNLTKHIENQGGMLSGELAKYIAETQKITESAARKRVQRLISPIHKLTGVFSEKQSFVYHATNYKKPIYFEKLGEALSIAAKRCAVVVNTINYHYGVISKSELANYSFSPITNIKGHLKYSTLLDKLLQLEIIHEYDDEHFGVNYYLNNKGNTNFRHYKAIEFSKDLIINQFLIWSRNIGFISFNSGKRNSLVGGFQFAITGPTYINGLVQYTNGEPKPGFFVADVLIGNTTNLEHVDFFIQKVTAIRASNPSLRLFPVLIVDGVEVSALNKLKQVGVLIASIKEIFGNDYNELLKNLINTITNAGAILRKDPENYIKLMSQLTKLVEGKTNNLRGDLFELAVGYYYGKYCKFLEIGKKVRNENEPKEREIDVFAIYEQEVRVVECKGYNYPLDDTYVIKYLNEHIPSIRKWLDKSFSNRDQIFEIWSTGGFTPEAQALLEKAKINTKKYKVDFLNKTDILNRAKELKTSKFVEILKDYYFKEIT